MKLNLPKYNIDVRRSPDGKLYVYDTLRRKYVALTPEEWVRQHFVNYLTRHLDYPSHLMANEVGLKLNGLSRRCDTVIYDHAARPLAIVEYKATTVDITAAVFDQIVRYNMVLDVDWLMVSNGLTHYCCHVNEDRNSYTFLREIPPYKSLI